MPELPEEPGIYWAKAFGSWYIVNWQGRRTWSGKDYASLPALIVGKGDTFGITHVAVAGVTEWGEQIVIPDA